MRFTVFNNFHDDLCEETHMVIESLILHQYINLSSLHSYDNKRGHENKNINFEIVHGLNK